MDTTFAADTDPLADPRVFQAVQDYQAELDAGRRPDRVAFAARYREVAEAVAGCLSGLEFLRAGTPRATTTAIADDSRLGDFRILREVGRGGMGVVYEAEQASLGRRVAVKVLSAVVPDDRARQRFRNEAQAAASLTHPHIIPVYAVGDDGDSLFLVMRFVRRRSLAAHVRDWQEASAPASKVPTTTADDTATERKWPEVAEPNPPLPFPPPPAPDYCRAAARLVAAAADALQHAHVGALNRANTDLTAALR